MSTTGVRGLLGDPSLIRNGSPAQYWRYSYEGCDLDLYAYRDPRTGFDRIAYLELRGRAFPAPTDGYERLEARLRPEAEKPHGVERLLRGLRIR